jgi:hypothetical protein
VLDSDATLLRDRQRSNAVSDAISAETISRSGSSNAADAMEKATGASVVGGKYVYVRGLGERYSATQLNGVDLPSADPDRKAVHFDLFPAGLLDNIVTLKTFTPDRPGNFSGGLVDISTKTYPDQLTARFSITSSVNTQTHFGSDFLTSETGSVDIFGRASSAPSIPALLSGGQVDIPSPARARRDAELAAQLNQYSKAFNDDMSPIIQTAPVNSSASLTVGNQVGLLGRPLGFIMGATYKHAASSYDDGIIGRYSFTGTALTPDLLMADLSGKEEVDLGGMANLSYKLSSRHEIGINSMYSRSVESKARFQSGAWPKELGSDSTAFFVSRTMQYQQRDLKSLHLHGQHNFPALAATTIEWSAAASSTDQNEPDTRFFANTRRVLGGNLLYSAQGTNYNDPSRYFRNLSESNRDLKIDVSTPFKQWSSLSAKFKFGAAYQTTDRTFNERVFTYTPVQPFDGDDSSYFAPDNMGIVAVDEARGRYTFGNTIRDATKPKNNYTGEREIAAGYAMIELPLSRTFKVVTGARVETTKLKTVSQDETQDVGSLDDVDVLPSANLIVRLSEKMNLRGAYTRTLARPTFREIAPFESFDFILANFRIGNPDLERTRIQNVDFRWEWFRRPGEILAVSFFYKKMQDAIEQVIIGGTNGQLKYENVPQANITGFEIEARTKLDVVPFLRLFSAGVNLSVVRSKVDIAETELAVRRAIDPTASGTRNLQGQSPYIINADLSYGNDRTGTEAGLYFNVFGRRLSNVSLGGTPDVYEQPSPQLDLTFSQRMLREWSVKLGVKNVLDSSFRESYSFEGQDYTYYSYKFGRSFSLGFSYQPWSN